MGHAMQDQPIDPEGFDFIPRRKPVIPNSVLGMGLFLFAEFMLFMGLVSAFLIIKTNAPGQIWPPPGQPRLPIGETAFNTVMLLLSAVVLVLAHRAYRRADARFKWYLLGAIGLGAFFVAFQGVEWLALIDEGLTLTSSTHGSFFYLIVGCHALHAIFAIGLLGFVYIKTLAGDFRESTFWAAEFFWYFVVGMWPLLYWLIYL